VGKVINSATTNFKKDDLNQAVISIKQTVQVLGHSVSEGNDRRRVSAAYKGR